MSLEGPSHIVVVAISAHVIDRLRLALPHARVSWTEPVSPSEASLLAREPGSRLVIVDLEVLDPALVEAWKAIVGEGVSVPPVLGLTSRPESLGKLAALVTERDGASGVPSTSDELLVRVAMLTGRAGAASSSAEAPPTDDDLVVDVLHRRARLGGQEMHLTGVEQSLLSLFLAHPGEVLSRERILNDVWGVDYVPDSNVVDRHIRSLRRKLGDDWHHPRFIETVHARGYRLMPDPARGRPDAAADSQSAGTA